MPGHDALGNPEAEPGAILLRAHKRIEDPRANPSGVESLRHVAQREHQRLRAHDEIADTPEQTATGEQEGRPDVPLVFMTMYRP